MDFVSRLKQFLELKQIPITQFADNCRIPRPTLSQLLNGRNKKVSDEVIGKIHDAYPSISVMWLMFGEGDMLTSGNARSSSDNTVSSSKDEEPGFFAKNQMENILFDDMFNTEEIENPDTSSDSPTTIQFPKDFVQSPGENETGTGNEGTTKVALEAVRNLANETSNKKRIVNIIVYYDDNSFEAFVPRADK